MTAKARSAVASNATSIEPRASRQRILCHQRARKRVPLELDEIGELTSVLGRTNTSSNLKFVTDAPYRFNVAILRVGLYFLAQSTDMDINDMPIAIIIVAPDFIHQHFTRVHTLR